MIRLNLKQSFLCLIASASLFGAGWYADSWYHCHYDQKSSRRVHLHGFRYTSPLLDVELPEGYRVDREPLPFKYKFKDYVRDMIATGQVRNMSIYYRDLSDGPWFGINEKVDFSAASMMKIPVMIAWLKRAEKDPRILKSRFEYDGKQDMNVFEAIKPQQSIVQGWKYTVEELLRYMLQYSDNNAMAVLYYGLSQQELGEVLEGMDVNNRPGKDGNLISSHSYSGFFRILYNAAYLNREMSEKALQLLSLQDFPQGIAAGVPKGVKVASKFGECVTGARGEIKQLHEFGIVYHPKGPYIIGVMTEGNDLSRQAEIIRTVSAMLYAEVSGSMK